MRPLFHKQAWNPGNGVLSGVLSLAKLNRNVSPRPLQERMLIQRESMGSCALSADTKGGLNVAALYFFSSNLYERQRCHILLTGDHQLDVLPG